MDENTLSTLERIQQAALDEFSEKGFWRFPAPDRKKRRRDYRGLLRLLFQQGSPVRFHCRTPCRRPYGQVYGSPDFLRGTSEEQQPDHMGVESSDCVHWMVDYICRHREPVKLLLGRSEGTSYEHFVHNMVEVEVEYTLKYMDVLRRLGRDIPELDEQIAISLPAACLTESSRS